MKNLFKHISFLLLVAFASISNSAFAQPGYNEGTQDTIIISRPTSAPSGLSFSSVTSSSLVASFTAGNGTARLVVCRPSAYELTAPTDLRNYTANSTYGSGTALGNGFVVGTGNISQVSISGLSSNTEYCIDVFEYDGSASANSALYLTTSSVTSCKYTLAIAPTVGSSSVNSIVVTSTTTKFNFTPGNGQGRVIIWRPSSATPVAPTNFVEIGAGVQIGQGHVIATGENINGIDFDGLDPYTDYCYDVYEYNGDLANSRAVYNTNAVYTICLKTLASAPTVSSSSGSFSNITTNSMTLDLTAGNGQGRIIVCRPSSATAVAPTNFTVYSGDPYLSAGSQLGQGFVIASGNVNSVSFDGLVQNTNYCFDVYEYNGDLGNSSAVFNTNSVYTICKKTPMVYPFTGASNFTVTQNNPTSLAVSWTSGSGNGRIVLVSTSPINSTPTDATIYLANASYAAGDSIGNAFVAYNNDGNSFTLTNLEPKTTYYFNVIEYTNNAEDPAYASSLALVDSATTIPSDSDNDGVVDAEDMFPNDQYRAYATSYPANGYGTLLFEDLWPAVGDYDFNDLVVDYKYSVVANADNNAVEATFKFVTRAIGGALHNGFAFQINGLDPAKILSVTGTKTNGITWTSLNPNGTEVGNNTNANIPVIKDAYDLLPTTGGYWFVNVEPNAPDVGTDTTTVVITFINNGTAPAAGTAAASILSSVNFNPYIVVAQERGKEIHLANMPPSELMNNSYFGNINDRSVPGANIYYKSEQGLPWALNIDQSIPYTIEKTDFVTAYPNFFNWANSGGANNTDWYINKAGNRVTNKLIIR